AESRVRKLAQETPAAFVMFDLLVDQHGKSLIGLPLQERRQRLERFADGLTTGRDGAADSGLVLSPSTTQRSQAVRWLRSAGGALDGIVAKRMAERYQPGERSMLKIKRIRSADCVVGGFRYASHGKIVGSLLLGLYDDDGLLHHVGFTSTLSTAERERLTPKLEALVRTPGFT